MKTAHLKVNPVIQEAVDHSKPVVALESTIISHGMPYPQNVETALEVENIVKENGAMPATIAIIKGELKAGLTPDEIDYLGREGQKVTKVSRRDIPFMVAGKKDGATTVASTMIIAAMAGIRFFATGGIGGVHRDAQQTFDISADLQELSKTNVAVFCAGVKSILDIGLTLEYLETFGVPVIGYKTEEMPAFYTPKSGYKVDYRLNTPYDIAESLKAKWDMNLKGGAVIANPIPKKYAMDEVVINTAIDNALKEMNAKGIKGKASTPFLLAKVSELTKGNSLFSNIRLVFNNAGLAARTAVAYYRL
jgi:pseudouridine-5'-phosphate glycosidase